MSADERWMHRALALAARAAGETNPNPLVGCVIVRNGRVVGEGFHRRAGGPHAEVIALEMAGARARGATLYVTLEPCVHRGRTPPCTPRLIQAGLARVVAAVRDPNPLVDGRGLAGLRRAGVRVRSGVLGREALDLNHRFVVAQRRQRPFITLKAGMTLDGRIATAAGHSQWITSPFQRRSARRLRRLHDAVVVGIGTVLADNPVLLPAPAVHRPFVRLVLDSHYRTPLDSKLVRGCRSSPVWIAGLAGYPHRRAALAARGVEILCDPRSRDRVSLAWLVRSLWRRGLTSLLVEGGSAVLGSFLAARLCDEVRLYRAPLLLGGRDSRPVFGGANPTWIGEALRVVPARAGQSSSIASLDEIWRPVRS